MLFGYCTNVHAGADLAQTRANLQRYAVAVRQKLGEPMGVGLWLSASAARQLTEQSELLDFRSWLEHEGLIPYTMNGFPYGDFHGKVVKHAVYHPTWRELTRVAYTRNLIDILDMLLPAGVQGSISTLPLAWGNPAPSTAEWQAYAESLHALVRYLERLEQTRQRLIHLCIEPEPGCALQWSTDIVRFFEDYLLPGQNAAKVLRYLRVCHDVCHAAVMFEEQAEVLARYRKAGILVGKVQVSSAVRAAFEELPAEERPLAREQLAGFHEERYLHQTMMRRSRDEKVVFYEDLSQALAAEREPKGEWRVHFHVPIYLTRFGRLDAMQNAIHDCLHATTEQDVPHWEVETYAWDVLPAELRQPDLAEGIADEVRWLRSTWNETRR